MFTLTSIDVGYGPKINYFFFGPIYIIKQTTMFKHCGINDDLKCHMMAS